MPGQQTKVDVGSLEKRITELQKNLAFVGQSTNASSSDLYQIIHHPPGWTSIAQVEIANQLLDAMNRQATAMRDLRNVLDAHVKQSAGQG